MVDAREINYSEIMDRTDNLKNQIAELEEMFKISIPQGLRQDFINKGSFLKNTIEDIEFKISDYQYE